MSFPRSTRLWGVTLAVAALTAMTGCFIDDPTFMVVDAGNDLIDATDGPPGQPMLQVSTTMLTVDEGSMQTFTVQLTAPPTGTELVNVTSTDVANKIRITPSSVLFDDSNWSTPRAITITGLDDPDTVDETIAVTLTPQSPAITAQVVDVTVNDDDGVAIDVTPLSLDITEGGTGSLAVHLRAQPPANVVVAVSSSNPAAATVPPATLVFTPSTWADDQTVVVSGVEDVNASSDSSTLTFTSTGLTDVTVDVQVADNDVLAISPSTANLGALTEGGSGSFTVRLTQQPPGNVTVTVTSSDATIAAPSPAMLTFSTTTWNVPQTVTVSLPDDVDTANEAAVITLAATGLPDRTVALSVLDDDTQVIVGSPSPLSVTEGMMRTLNVSLGFQPAADVTVTVTSLSTTIATVAPATLTFTSANYATPQLVAVTGVQDADASVGLTAVRLESAALGIFTDVSVTVNDDDTLGIETSAAAVALTEAGMGTFGVRLSAMPGAAITVSINSMDASAATVTPATLTFTTANWNVFQTVTVSGVQDQDLADDMVPINITAPGLSARVVDATVADDDTQVVVVTSPMISVNEGGTGTVGVHLTYQPTANVTVTLTSADPTTATVSPASLTFTPVNYDTPQNLTISGVEDVDIVDDATTITAASTGATSATVMVTVNDNDVLGIETNVTTLTIGEAGTGTVGVRLLAPPTADTTVTLSSSDTGAATVGPASLTFSPANWDTYQNLTVTGVNDPDGVDETVTITAASPGLTSRTVTVSVVDDDPQDILLSTTALPVTEGGTATFTVRLATMPVASVTVSITSGDTAAATASPASLTFTAANYNTPQTVTVTGVQDSDLANESVVLTAASASVTSRTVSVTVTDDDTQVVVVSPATLNLTEGGSGAFAVTLGFQPAAATVVTIATSNAATANPSPTTLTFMPATYATPQMVTVAAPQDPDAVNNGAILTASSPGATSGTVTVNITDDDVLAIETSTAALTVAEGGTGTFGVRLTAQPTASTTVTVSSPNTAAATVSPTTLTFTTANWNAFQTVTVNGVQDPDAVNESVTLNLTGGTMPVRNVAVTVTEDDVQDLVVSASSLTITEGGTGTFNVHLAAQPQGTVTVTLASTDPGAATPSPATLTFTTINYAADQTVTVTGVQDPDLVNESATVSVAATGFLTKNVGVAVTDEDVQDIQVSTAALTVTEGLTATFTVRLAFQPAANVTVTVASSNAAAATVAPASLTFTPANYNTAQTVTVTGVNDANLTDESSTITVASAGLSSKTVATTITDDDVQNITVSTSSLTVTEGGTGTFTVRLTAQPSANVTVNLSSSNTAAATAAPASLTFTSVNYNVAQTVTVTGVSDLNTVGETATITAASAGLASQQVAVTVNDDDVQALVVSTTSLSVTEGMTRTFTVNLAFQPSANVSVTVSSSNATAAGVSPATLTFTSVNYAMPQTVTVTGTSDVNLTNESATVTVASASIPSQTVAVTVTDDDVQDLTVSASALTVTEGATGTFTVRLAFQPSADVTVTLSSSNAAGATVTPATMTFTTANYATAQTATVSGVSDVNLTAETATVSVASVGLATKTVAVTVNDDDVQGLTLSTTALTLPEGGTGTFTVRLDYQPSANVSVTVSSSNTLSATTAPATLTFTSANYATPQTVTVNGVEDVNLVNDAVTITVASAGVPSKIVAVTATDNDVQDLTLSASALTVNEGGTGTFTVRLAFQPAASVTVNVASTATATATAAPTTLTFTTANYATPQTVTVTGVEDVNVATDSAQINVSSAGLTTKVVAVTAPDNDTQAIALTRTFVEIGEGASTSVGVSLAFQPSGNVTVSLSTSSTTYAGIGTTSMTFTPANWNVAQNVTITTASDTTFAHEVATVTLTSAGLATRTITVQNIDDDLINMSPTDLGNFCQLEVSAPTNVHLNGPPYGGSLTVNFTGTTTRADPWVNSLTFTSANYSVDQENGLSPNGSGTGAAGLRASASFQNSVTATGSVSIVCM